MTWKRSRSWLSGSLALTLALGTSSLAAAQQGLLGGLPVQEDVPGTALAAEAPRAPEAAPAPARSAAAERILARAARDPGRHIVVSLSERRLWLRQGSSVLFTAPVGVGKSVVLEYEGQQWDFRTPQGERRVLRKQENPLWVPPDWHYVELALAQRWELVWVKPNQSYPLRGGASVTTRGNQLGRRDAEGRFHPVPQGEELVVDGVLYAPPIGSVNRQIPGQLGRYKLDLGDSYYLHGTSNPGSVGAATTHGCIRLRDDDLARLYAEVPVGTAVYIYGS